MCQHINQNLIFERWLNFHLTIFNNLFHFLNAPSPELSTPFMHSIIGKNEDFYVYETYKTIYASLDSDNSGMTQIPLFLGRGFLNFNFLAITKEREIYSTTSISKQCMESYQFPFTNKVIFRFLDYVNNSTTKF